jgi:perosamine synthetase
MFDDVVDFVRSIYGKEGVIPLHEPLFIGNEKKYLNECIDSTFVSSIGQFVNKFEEKISHYTGAKYTISTVNGTAALHIALKLLGTDENSEVITQPLTFIAICNAISYCNAKPIFVDVDKDTMGLSPKSLETFLVTQTIQKNGSCYNKKTDKKITAVIAMHTFGFPCRVNDIKKICKQYNIKLIEDSAESLGSFINNQHTGTYGDMGIISFNGNKIITGGGGGCIITNDENLAKIAKHLTTTAKVPHKWEFAHDMVGYNYRMPNINAALLVAQLENLEKFLKNKRELAMAYKDFFTDKAYYFVEERINTCSNYWLNTIILKDITQRNLFLDETNAKGVMTRPIWVLMNELSIYQSSQCAELINAEWLAKRVVNLPSSVILS